MVMDPRTVPAGTTFYIGAPAGAQLTEVARTALAQAAAGVPGITEAHVPQVATSNGGQPRQVPVVVAGRGELDQVMQALGPKLNEVMPADVYLDVMPLDAGHPLLPAVRAADCQIFGTPAPRPSRRPWWRFW